MDASFGWRIAENRIPPPRTADIGVVDPSDEQVQKEHTKVHDLHRVRIVSNPGNPTRVRKRAARAWSQAVSRPFLHIGLVKFLSLFRGVHSAKDTLAKSIART
jgi:hypothetical protein